MLMLTRTHRREMAAKDAEVLAAGLTIVGLRSVVTIQQRTIEQLTSRSGELASDLDVTTARLNLYEGPRTRGPDGRYQPTSRKSRPAKVPA